MKSFKWNLKKNQKLLEERGISFEEVVFYLQNDGLIDDIKHPNEKDYPHQRMFVVDIEGYSYIVPYVETNDEIFLKTVIPSRKATKRYSGVRDEEN